MYILSNAFLYYIYQLWSKNWLAGVKKPEIFLDKYKKLAFTRSKIVFWEEKKRKNGVLVCICFKIRELNYILILNSRICLWKLYKFSGNNKYKYKHELNKHETKIESKK